MKIVNNCLGSVLAIVLVFTFMSCNQENPVSFTNENSVFFTLKLESKYHFENDITVEKIRVNFMAVNTNEIPELIINNSKIDFGGIDTVNNKVFLSGFIDINSKINFKVSLNGTYTTGVFIMPEEVKNVRCNGLFLTSYLGFPKNYIGGSIPTAENYVMTWDGNGSEYLVYTHSGYYSGSASSCEMTNNNFDPDFIEITSFLGYRLQSGDKPNYLGSYGSGYVTGSRAGSFFYNSNN